MPLDRLTAWPDPQARERRQHLGRLLGADLRAAAQPSLALWQLLTRGDPMPVTDAPLRPETVSAATTAGLFDTFDIDGVQFVRATACITNAGLPSGELAWLACDLPWEDWRSDHVPGPGNASRTLVDALAVERAETAADIGTGCGFVALHLSALAEHVIATDLNPRALAFAELTAALNARTWDLRLGSFLAPLRGTAVDLIVANPPFVLGNPDAPAVFRDGSLRLAQTLARDVAAALPHGGTGQFLANWAYVDGTDPTKDITKAAAGSDCLVIERAAVDLPTYVDLWVLDRGDPRHERWVDSLTKTGAYAIGTGVVTLRKGGRRTGTARLHEDTDEPLGPAIADWLADGD